MSVSDSIADRWVALAEDQRTYDSHIVPAENRGTIREAILHHVVADEALVCRDNEAVVGFVTFTVETGQYEQDTSRGLVQNIYVAPEYRNRGLGTKLLTAAEESLAARGVETVALEVMATNENARQFYRDRGYSPHRVELEKSVESDTL